MPPLPYSPLPSLHTGSFAYIRWRCRSATILRSRLMLTLGNCKHKSRFLVQCCAFSFTKKASDPAFLRPVNKLVLVTTVLFFLHRIPYWINCPLGLGTWSAYKLSGPQAESEPLLTTWRNKYQITINEYSNEKKSLCCS